jgi:rubredoxin
MASRAVPVIIQLVIFYIFISWFVRLLRRRRTQTPTGTPGQETRPTASSSTPAEQKSMEIRSQGGAVRREEVMFNGVRWHVTFRPRRDLASGTRALHRDVYVEEPPRCPKCGLGVVETRSWLGYTWSCPECGLRKRSSQSMQAVAEALARGLH